MINYVRNLKPGRSLVKKTVPLVLCALALSVWPQEVHAEADLILDGETLVLDNETQSYGNVSLINGSQLIIQGNVTLNVAG